MNWKSFLQSIAAAAIGGAATSLTQCFTDPSHLDLNHIGPVAGAGALVGVLAYLKTPPTPPTPPDKSTTTVNFPQTK